MENYLLRTRNIKDKYKAHEEKKWATYFDLMNLSYGYRENSISIPIENDVRMKKNEHKNVHYHRKFRKYTPSFYIPNCFGSLEEAWVDIVSEDSCDLFEHRLKCIVNGIDGNDSRFLLKGAPHNDGNIVAGYYHLTDSIYNFDDCFFLKKRGDNEFIIESNEAEI